MVFPGQPCQSWVMTVLNTVVRILSWCVLHVGQLSRGCNRNSGMSSAVTLTSSWFFPTGQASCIKSLAGEILAKLAQRWAAGSAGPVLAVGLHSVFRRFVFEMAAEMRGTSVRPSLLGNVVKEGFLPGWCLPLW